MYAGTENLKPEYAFSGKLAAGVKDRFEGDRTGVREAVSYCTSPGHRVQA